MNIDVDSDAHINPKSAASPIACPRSTCPAEITAKNRQKTFIVRLIQYPEPIAVSQYAVAAGTANGCPPVVAAEIQYVPCFVAV